MTPRPSRLGGLAFALLAALPACIDRAPGLVVDVRDTELTVGAPSDPSAALTLDITLGVRVGKHALNGSDFILPRADLYVADAPVAQILLDRPAGFGGSLEPGQSETVHTTGSSPLSAWASARDAICADGAEVLVVVPWQGSTVPDDPLAPRDMVAGSADGVVSRIVCN